MFTNALEPTGDEGRDFEMVADSVWIVVDDIALWIRRDGTGGVVIEACPNGHESDTLDTFTVAAPDMPEYDEDEEEGDDLCDICHASGVSVSRTTLSGGTVCDSKECQDEADRLDMLWDSGPGNHLTGE